MANNCVTLTGDWRKLRHRFNRLSQFGQRGAKHELYEIAQEVKEALHETVNSSPAPENAESTVKRKGFNNPLLETGGFMESDSIIIDRVKESNDETTYVVKGNPKKFHERSGEGHRGKKRTSKRVSYEDVVAISETGGGNVPARHVLTITYDRKREEIERSVIKRLNEDLFGD